MVCHKKAFRAGNNGFISRVKKDKRAYLILELCRPLCYNHLSYPHEVQYEVGFVYVLLIALMLWSTANG